MYNCHCWVVATTTLSLSFHHGSRRVQCVVVVVVVWTCYRRRYIAPTSSLLSLRRSHLTWQSPCVLCHCCRAGVDVPSLTSSLLPSHLCRSWPLHRRIGVMVGGWVVALVVAMSPTPVMFGLLHWWWPHCQCLWWPGRHAVTTATITLWPLSCHCRHHVAVAFTMRIALLLLSGQVVVVVVVVMVVTVWCIGSHRCCCLVRSRGLWWWLALCWWHRHHRQWCGVVVVDCIGGGGVIVVVGHFVVLWR